MATQTTNYGLKKPAYSDTADIGVINSNMDIIDVKMKEIEDKAGSGGGGTSVTVDSELSTTSENPVQNKVITQALNGKGTYSKPIGGIPKTDLANEVQTSLGKADTALQEHQDISGKADKAEVTALYNSISDAWDSATAYTVGQYCIYNNALWKCLVANTNTEPTEGTHWKKVSVANEITSLNSSLQWFIDNGYLPDPNNPHLYFYYYGNQFTNITGGWTSWCAADGVATIHSDNLFFGSSSTNTGGFRTVNKINFDNINKLRITYLASQSSGADSVIGLTDLTTPQSGAAASNSMVFSETFSASTSQKTIEIDTSTWSGSHYLAFGVRNLHYSIYAIEFVR